MKNYKLFLIAAVFVSLAIVLPAFAGYWWDGDATIYNSDKDVYYIFKGDEYVRHTHGGKVDK